MKSVWPDTTLSSTSAHDQLTRDTDHTTPINPFTMMPPTQEVFALWAPNKQASLEGEKINCQHGDVSPSSPLATNLNESYLHAAQSLRNRLSKQQRQPSRRSYRRWHRVWDVCCTAAVWAPWGFSEFMRSSLVCIQPVAKSGKLELVTTGVKGEVRRMRTPRVSRRKDDMWW